LRNAVRYTPAGGTISITLDKKPGCVAVAVADTGCGIAEADIDRIFFFFFRSEQGEE